MSETRLTLWKITYDDGTIMTVAMTPTSAKNILLQHGVKSVEAIDNEQSTTGS